MSSASRISLSSTRQGLRVIPTSRLRVTSASALHVANRGGLGVLRVGNRSIDGRSLTAPVGSAPRHPAFDLINFARKLPAQVVVTLLCHNNSVLNSNPDVALGDVDAGLDSNHRIFWNRVIEVSRIVNLQPDKVPEVVNVIVVVARIYDHLIRRLTELFPFHSSAHFRQGGLLRAKDDVIKLSLFWRELPVRRKRPRHVADVEIKFGAGLDQH